MKEKKFKVGDRVVGVGTMGVVSLEGKTGTILPYDRKVYDYTVKFDEENEFFHSCDGKCENHHGLFVYEENIKLLKKEFKVGDRVRAIAKCDGYDLKGYTGRVVNLNSHYKYYVGVEFDKEFDYGHTCDGKGKNHHCRYCEPESLELINDETIVIYRKDNEVIALDKSTGKKAVAKCSPADEFNFNTGAKLAFERLTHNVTFRVLCIKDTSCTKKSSHGLKGNVYEFIDGVTTWSVGKKSGCYNNFKELIKSNCGWDKHFVELKEGDDPAEILKKYDKDIKVGDVVKIIDTGAMYTTYKEYFKANKVPADLMICFAYGESFYEKGVCSVTERFIVEFIANDIAVIKSANTGKTYLIQIEGLEKW